MAVVRESRELAAELGILDRAVFFNDSWVDYADRQNYLTEADVGVSTHFAHIETTFSFRTRILDYLWGGLPMVVTEGDSFAELVATEDLGIAVPPENVEALADALELMLFDDARIAAARKNIARVREQFQWSNTLRPLIEFVREPRHAPDRENRAYGGAFNAGRRGASKPYGLRHDLSLAFHHLRHGGPGVVVRKISNRLRAK